MKVYGANDTTCKLPSFEPLMSKNMDVTLAGVGTGAGGSDKVDVVMENRSMSGETVTVTQVGSGISIVYSDGLTKGGNYKDLLLLSNNSLRWGDNSGTATTYPNALSVGPSEVFTKQ